MMRRMSSPLRPTPRSIWSRPGNSMRRKRPLAISSSAFLKCTMATIASAWSTRREEIKSKRPTTIARSSSSFENTPTTTTQSSRPSFKSSSPSSILRPPPDCVPQPLTLPDGHTILSRTYHAQISGLAPQLASAGLLNPHLRIARPELMVITGPPGDGKSQFGTALGCNLAHYHNWPGAIIQFEDDVERNREDLIRYWCGKHGIRLSIDRQPTGQELAQANEWIDRMFRTISPNEDLDDVAVNLDWLRSNIEEAATRHG